MRTRQDLARIIAVVAGRGGDRPGCLAQRVGRARTQRHVGGRHADLRRSRRGSADAIDLRRPVTWTTTGSKRHRPGPTRSTCTTSPPPWERMCVGPTAPTRPHGLDLRRWQRTQQRARARSRSPSPAPTGSASTPTTRTAAAATPCASCPATTKDSPGTPSANPTDASPSPSRSRVGRTAGRTRAIDPVPATMAKARRRQGLLPVRGPTGRDLHHRHPRRRRRHGNACACGPTARTRPRWPRPAAAATDAATSSRTVEVSLPGTYWFGVYTYNASRSGSYSVRVLPRYDQGLTWDTLGEPNGRLALAESIRRRAHRRTHPRHRPRPLHHRPRTTTTPTTTGSRPPRQGPTPSTSTTSPPPWERMCVRPYRSDQTPMASTCGGGNGRSNVLATVEVSLPGTYWFSVYTYYASRSGSYTRASPPPLRPRTHLGHPRRTRRHAGTSLGPRAGAEPRLRDRSVPATLAKYDDDIDWYRFQTTRRVARYSVTTSSVPASLRWLAEDLSVHDSSGNSGGHQLVLRHAIGDLQQHHLHVVAGWNVLRLLRGRQRTRPGTYTVCATRTGTPCATRYNGYQPLTPARILDTRSGLGRTQGRRSRPASRSRSRSAGRGGVPADGGHCRGRST